MRDKDKRSRRSASSLDPALWAKLPQLWRKQPPLVPDFNTQSDPLYAANREAQTKTESQRREEQVRLGSIKRARTPAPVLKPRGGPAPGGGQSGSAMVREEYHARLRQLEYDEMSKDFNHAREMKGRTRSRE